MQVRIRALVAEHFHFRERMTTTNRLPITSEMLDPALVLLIMCVVLEKTT